jgi:hypothetical protein
LLLIDQHRRIESVAARSVRVPFMLEPLRHDKARARALFADRRSDLWLLRALVEELRHCGATVPSSEHHPDRIFDAGLHAIANGTIGVGSVLRAGAHVTFDHERPSEWYNLNTVVFPRHAITGDVAATLLRIQANRHAFEAALEHPIGRARPTRPPRQHPAGYLERPTDDSDVLAARVAWLLAIRSLALIPRDLSRRRLRLVWIEHQIAYAPATIAPAPSPAPAPAPAPSPAPSNSPVSVLADAPEVVSPQAQALIDAANNGLPFCEECARRAAEQDDSAAAPVFDDLAGVLPDELEDLSAQAQTLIDAAEKGAPFCAECARLAKEEAARELSNA